MHPHEYQRYVIAARRGDIHDIAKTIEADRCLRDAGAESYTLEAEVKREQRRRTMIVKVDGRKVRVPRTIPLDDPSVQALASTTDPFAGQEAEDGAAAVEMYGTPRERDIYRMDQRGYTRKAIAAELGIDLSTISRALQACQRHVQEWLERTQSWRLVYQAETHGQHLDTYLARRGKQTDAEREAGELRKATGRITDMDIDVEPAGIGSDGEQTYRVADHWVLRCDQIITLASIGEVRTCRYGLVQL